MGSTIMSRDSISLANIIAELHVLAESSFTSIDNNASIHVTYVISDARHNAVYGF